jgi:hypothetical protein
MQQLETSFTPPEVAPKKGDQEKVKIRFYVFFDGTLNNRTNIEQRLLAAPDQKLTAEEREEAKKLKERMAAQKAQEDNLLSKPPTTMEELDQVNAIVAERALGKPEELYKEHGAKKDKKTGEAIGDNSYEGYYTNVVKMERQVIVDDGETPEYDLALKVYIEGSGSMDKLGDETAGFALAMSESGVPAKVEKGMRKAITNIAMKNPDRSIIIEKLTLDVFGFSRGAASARTFINDAMSGRKTLLAGKALSGNDESTTVKAQLEGKGFTVNEVKVCFAGLFDTVSSYGLGMVTDQLDITHDAANNVKALSLDAVALAEEVLHLAAADEHRFNFSLTSIRSAGSNGCEIFLPGAHADIGGGYRDAVTERQILRGNPGLGGVILHGNYPSIEEAEKDIERLVAAGWYRKGEFTVTPILDDNDNVKWVKVEVIRQGQSPEAGIRNSYSRIPLNIMVKKAREKQIVFRDKFDRDEPFPDEVGNTVKSEIEKYVAEHGGKGKYTSDWSHWNNLPDPVLSKNTEPREWLRKLRHDFCHFSAQMNPGHDPRFDKGLRKRMIHNG